MTDKLFSDNPGAELMATVLSELREIRDPLLLQPRRIYDLNVIKPS